MSLSSNVTTLATRIASEFKALRLQLTGNNQGDLSGLATADKSSLVAAINELATTGGGAGDLIDDTTPSGSTTYSSNKIESLVGDVADDVTALTTTVNGKPDINDSAASTTSVYSSSKTDQQIAAAKAEILGGASSAFDTLLELENAVGSNESAIGTLTTQIGNRVRFDQAQTLTTTQQDTARANIDAAKASGDDGMGTVADYVAAFEAGLLP